MPDTHLPDLSDHRAAQLILQLQHVTQALAAVRQQAEVFDIILHDGLEVLGGIGGTVLLVQEDRLQVVARRGHEHASVWQDGDLAGHRPGTDALRSNTPLFFSREGDLAAAYPELEAQTGGVAAVASAVVPMVEDGRSLGVIMLDFRAPHDFTPDEQHFLLTLAAQCTIALERAQLSSHLERQVEERTRQIEEEARTQEAFVAFTESVGSETDVLALCHKSFEVMDARFDEYSSAYYEVQGGLWKALAWTTEMTAEQISMIRAGLPLDVPSFAQALETKQPVFIDGWDAEREKIENTDVFGPVCIYPLLVADEVRGLFTVGLRVGVQWQDRDRALMRAFGRSLTLALERTETARQLKLQNAELQARTQALGAFTRLTEAVGSETDVQALVRQAMTLLHETCDVEVVYVEREAGLFKATVWNPSADPALLSLLRHGFTLQYSGIAKLLQQNTAAFIDHWKTTPLLFEESEIFQSVAGYPYFVAGELKSVLMAGSRTSATWAERDKGIFRAVGRSLDLALERAATAQHLEEQNAELYVQTLALEGIAELTRDLTLPGGPQQLIEQVMDLVLSLLPSGYSSYWEIKDGQWQVTAHRGDVGRPEWQAARERGFPVGQFPTLDRPWQTRQPYFQSQYDPLQDSVPELSGHLASVATLPVMSRDEVVGVFGVCLFGHRPWGAADRALLQTTVQSLGLALERAEQAQQLEAESWARAAFAAFTEAIGTQTDVRLLAGQAIEVLRGRFPQASVGYYEREGELWKARVWTDNLREEVLALIRAGLPTQTPMIARMLQAQDVVFIDAWDPQREQLEITEEYANVGNVPLLVEGQVRAMLSVGIRDTRQWSEASRALVRSVGRGLTLALERSATARQLEAQNAELLARTQALEGFAELMRDLRLSSDAKTLIQRAQVLITQFIPHGFAVYYELEGEVWRLRSQAGSPDSPTVQAALDSALPYATVLNFRLPWESGEAFYQDAYDPALDQDVSGTAAIASTATLVLRVGLRPQGIFGYGLNVNRAWSSTDKAVLQSVVHSLGLALERAEQAHELTAQRDMLQASNEELEAFTYSVSHDLRTPVRHITSFGGLLRGSLPEPLSEKTARYFRIVEDGAKQLNQLIDGMLELSRTSRQELKPQVIDLNPLVTSVRREVTPTGPERKIVWQIAELPHVRADSALLRQVMNALLNNAVKYTRTREQALIEIWAEEREQNWAVLVRDNGVGFDPRYQDKLFSMFQRLHRQEDFEGAGVSLANARRIITRHGGMITAEAQVDQGATFSFTLPKNKS